MNLSNLAIYHNRDGNRDITTLTLNHEFTILSLLTTRFRLSLDTNINENHNSNIKNYKNNDHVNRVTKNGTQNRVRATRLRNTRDYVVKYNEHKGNDRTMNRKLRTNGIRVRRNVIIRQRTINVRLSRMGTLILRRVMVVTMFSTTILIRTSQYGMRITSTGRDLAAQRHDNLSSNRKGERSIISMNTVQNARNNYERRTRMMVLQISRRSRVVQIAVLTINDLARRKSRVTRHNELRVISLSLYLLKVNLTTSRNGIVTRVTRRTGKLVITITRSSTLFRAIHRYFHRGYTSMTVRPLEARVRLYLTSQGRYEGLMRAYIRFLRTKNRFLRSLNTRLAPLNLISTINIRRRTSHTTNKNGLSLARRKILKYRVIRRTTSGHLQRRGNRILRHLLKIINTRNLLRNLVMLTLIINRLTRTTNVRSKVIRLLLRTIRLLLMLLTISITRNLRRLRRNIDRDVLIITLMDVIRLLTRVIRLLVILMRFEGVRIIFSFLMFGGRRPRGKDTTLQLVFECYGTSTSNYTFQTILQTTIRRTTLRSRTTPWTTTQSDHTHSRAHQGRHPFYKY